MKVSIIIPISDNYPFSKKAIISLLNQSYKNIEILICLNGNDSKYNNLLKKNFSSFSKIKFYYQKNKNIVDALNLLISKSTGRYIARMDADDISHPERISRQIDYIIKNNIDFLSTYGEVVDEDFNRIYFHKQRLKKKYFTNPILHPSIIIKSSILKKFKYRQIPFAEDYELYLRLEKNGIRLHCLDKVLIYYQLNKKNLSNPIRSFYLILSTLIISKSFRENLEVNTNFFKIINYQKKFKNYFIDYKKNFVDKNFFFKLIFIIRFFFQKNNLIRKLIFSRILYNSYKEKKTSEKFEFNIKKTNPFVSIVIPTYNSEKTIKKTLNSILRQSYKNFEIIIIDNSDNDLSVNTIRKNFNSNKLKIYRIKDKILNGQARNIGVEKSNPKTDLIAFCDSDDWWKIDKIEKQINEMTEKKYSVCFTNYDFFISKSKKIIKNYFKIPFKSINFSMLGIRNLIGTSSILMDKKLFKLSGGFPESKYFYSFEDYFLWLKIAKITNIGFLDENLTVYRDDRQNSATKYSKSFLSQRIRILLFYMIKLDLNGLVDLINANLKLIFKPENTKDNDNEYINLL